MSLHNIWETRKMAGTIGELTSRPHHGSRLTSSVQGVTPDPRTRYANLGY